MSKNDIIPDGEVLYRFVHPGALPPNQKDIPPGIFQDTNLSCDWKRFRSDPFTSFHITEGKNIIIEIIIVDEIRNPRNPKRTGEFVEAWKQNIIHNPINSKDDPIHGENLAHSLIQGKKKAAVTTAIINNSRFYQNQST